MSDPVNLDDPRDRDLERAARRIAEHARDLTVTGVRRTVAALHLAQNGHPRSASTENDRTSGHTTVTDDTGTTMPAVADPTGENALIGDRARAELAELARLLPGIDRDLRTVAAIVGRHEHLAVAPPDDHAIIGDRRACQHHARFGIREPAHDDRDPGGNLGARMPLCQACQRVVRHAGRLPTEVEIRHRERTGKFPPIRDA